MFSHGPCLLYMLFSISGISFPQTSWFSSECPFIHQYLSNHRWHLILLIWFPHTIDLRGSPKNSSLGLFLNDREQKAIDFHRSGLHSQICPHIVMGKRIRLSECQFYIYKNKINTTHLINCFGRIT